MRLWFARKVWRSRYINLFWLIDWSENWNRRLLSWFFSLSWSFRYFGVRRVNTAWNNRLVCSYVLNKREKIWRKNIHAFLRYCGFRVGAFYFDAPCIVTIYFLSAAHNPAVAFDISKREIIVYNRKSLSQIFTRRTSDFWYMIVLHSGNV